MLIATPRKSLSLCRKGTLKFMHRCHEVALKLMQCFAIGLNLPEDFFNDVSLLSYLSNSAESC